MGGRPLSDSTSWSDFAQHYWEQRPNILRLPSGSRLTNSSLVFEGLQEAANQLQTGSAQNPKDIRFHIGEALQLDCTPYLPQTSESSLEDYVARLSSGLGDAPFTLLINSFHQFTAPLWRHMRSYLGGLFETLGGLPAGMVDSHLMIARYGVSPFKVHKDPNSVFTFLVKGEKSIIVWPYQVFESKTNVRYARHKQIDLDGLDYRPYVTAGTILNGGEGDVLYWPSSYWHVGVANSTSIHASLHLTCHVNGAPRKLALDILRKLNESDQSELDWHSMYEVDYGRVRTGPSNLPQGLSRSLDRFSALVQGDQIREAIEAQWLSRVSGQGFDLLPNDTAKYPALAEQSLISMDPKFPVAWVRRNNKILFSAHGRVISLPADDWVVTLITILLAGTPRSINNVIADVQQRQSADGEAIRAVVNHLRRIGAIAVEGESTAGVSA